MKTEDPLNSCAKGEFLDADGYCAGFHKATILCLEICRKGKCIVSGDAQGTLGLWAISSGEVWEEPVLYPAANDKPFHEKINDLDFSSGNKWLATAGGGAKDTVIVWEWHEHPKSFMVNNSKPMVLKLLDGSANDKTKGINCIRFTLQLEDILGCCTGWRNFYLCNVFYGDVIGSYNGIHERPVTSIDFSSDLTTFITSSKGPACNGNLKLWDLRGIQTSSCKIMLNKNLDRNGHTTGVIKARFRTDHYTVISGDSSGVIKYWNSLSGKAYLTINAHNRKINDVIHHPHQLMVVSASDDCQIKLYDTGSMSKLSIANFNDERNWMHIVWNSSHGEVMCISKNAEISVWAKKSGISVFQCDLGKSVTASAWDE